MGGGPTAGAQLIMIIANAGAFTLTGTALTTARESLSNKEQENTIGSSIGRTTISIGCSDASTSGIVSVGVLKVERADSVPAANNFLPTNTEVGNEGLQGALRREQPGRVIFFDQYAIAADQPRVIHIKIDWKKYNMATIRQGDFYIIDVFNQGITGLTTDTQTRYKEYI